MVTKEICIHDQGKASCKKRENQKYQFLTQHVYQMMEVGEAGMMLGWEWYCVCVHGSVVSGTPSNEWGLCKQATLFKLAIQEKDLASTLLFFS
jgi:hypothetical protein